MTFEKWCKEKKDNFKESLKDFPFEKMIYMLEVCCETMGETNETCDEDKNAIAFEKTLILHDEIMRRYKANKEG